MALTPTYEIDLDYIAPEFSLLETKSGTIMSRDECFGEKGTLVVFMCNHCPFVKHINQGLIRLAHDCKSLGVNLVAISSNSVASHPQDGPEQMTALSEELGFPFVYLFDETQEVAKAYMASCTPDFTLFNKDKKAVYRGQMDGSRPGNDIENDGMDIRIAINAMLAGELLTQNQIPSIGCNIKWIPGNEPDYAS